MAPVPSGSTVAVTGASGFIGSHICGALLAAGYRVRAVVRDPTNADKTAHLRALATGAAEERLSFHKGELSEVGSYDEAFQGADAVVHTAAVVEINDVKDPEAEIVKPSLDGVRNVLASADKSGTVKRFVHTSSVLSAISFNAAPDTSFSEADWNDASTVANGDAYGYAKTAAEREAHAHASAEGRTYDLLAVNPGVCLGPSLCKAHTKASVVVIRQMLYGNAQVSYQSPFLDVRDVAEAHVRVLGLENVDGASPAEKRRFMIVSDAQMPVVDLGEPLQRLFPDYRVDAVSSIPKLAGALLGLPLFWRLFTTEFRRGMYSLVYTVNGSQSKERLGLTYRSLDDTLRDSVTSMVDGGFIKPRMKK